MSTPSFQSASVRDAHCQTCSCTRNLSTTSPPSSAQSRIIDLETEIRRTRKLLNELQRERNTLIPIYALPEDVLSEVFLCYAAAYRDEHIPAKDWIPAFAHIFSFWRQVALHTPLLFTLNFTSPETALALLGHTSSPVRLLYSDRYNDEPCDSSVAAALSYALAHPDRIGEINIDIYSEPDLLASAWANTARKFPSLKHLSLYQCRPDPLDQLVHLEAPVLQSLSLSRIKLDWSSPVLRSSTLTSLVLECVKAELEDVVTSLQHMLSLRTLCWNHYLPEASPEQLLDLTSIPCIWMLSLMCVEISGTTKGCLAVLHVLKAPALTRIDVHESSSEPLSENYCNYHALLDSMKVHWDRNYEVTTFHIRFSPSSPFYCTLRVGSSDPERDAVAATVHLNCRATHIPAWLSSRINEYGPVKLCVFCAKSSRYRWKEDYWRVFFTSLHHIEELCITSGTMSSYITGIDILVDPKILPRLKSIVVTEGESFDIICIMKAITARNSTIADSGVHGARPVNHVVLVGKIDRYFSDASEKLKEVVEELVILESVKGTIWS